MDNPRAISGPGQSPRDLRAAYAGQQRGRAARRHARTGMAGLKGAVLGAAIGTAAIVGYCLVAHVTFFWQLAAWDAALCAIAGYLLGRVGGGALAGTVLFGVAYAAALWLRNTPYNSVKMLQPLLPELEITVHGNFAMLAGVAVAGACYGYANSLK